MKWIIENPISIWIVKLFIAKKLEFRHKDKKLKIGYLSYAKNSTFEMLNTLKNNVSLNSVNLGKFTYISTNTKIQYTTIGKYCCIGPDCKIGLGKHPSNTFVSTHPAFFSSSDQIQVSFSNEDYFNATESITIGNDVWIGANTIILDGVKIEDGAIIGAGSVVTKNIPAYAIVAGVPAKIIKYRFNKNEIDRLLDIKWWDLEIDFLKENYKKFHNIDDFYMILNNV